MAAAVPSDTAYPLATCVIALTVEALTVLTTVVATEVPRTRHTGATAGVPDLSDFFARFPDDEACLTYLWRRRFAADDDGGGSDDGTARCPRCREVRRFRRYGTAERRRAWTCTGCGHHVHPTAGTILEKSSTGLRVWFQAAYLVARSENDVSARDLERALGIPYTTARRIRRALERAREIAGPAPSALDDDPPAIFVPPAPDGTEPARQGRADPAPVMPPRVSTARTSNLPIERTLFVGRREDIGTVRRLLRTSRLVTLVGAGGCGKTRLAARVGRELLPHAPGGVWWVDLAQVSASRSVIGAIMEALELRRPGESDPAEALREHLRDKDTLVILDNCEHLLDACAAVIGLLLDDCPGVRMLVTSREPVGVAEETVWRVPSLPLPRLPAEAAPADPDTLRRLTANDAVRLFVDRARHASPAFHLDAANATAVARICRQLDGIPLAIEFAAARVAALTPGDIADALDDCLAVLRGGRRGGLPRHHTLRASMDWSHLLLEEEERILFRRLAVFTGSFTLGAVKRVCGDERRGETPVLLAGLAAKSLVMVEEREATHRYRLLETVRQYAAEQLTRSGELPEIRDRHLEWALELVERAAPEMETGRQAEWMAVLGEEYPNLRTALDRAVEQGGQAPLRLVNGLAFFHFIRSDIVDGGTCVARALAAGERAASPLRARALWGAAYVAFVAKDYDTAREDAVASLEMARELGDRSIAVRALATLGNIDVIIDPARARVHIDESLALCEQAKDPWCLAYATCLRAMSWAVQGALEPARRDLALARERAELIGDGYMLAWHWLAAALIALFAGDPAEARSASERSAAFAAQAGDPACAAWAALCHAEVDCRTGRARAAREAIAAAIAERRITGTPTGRMYLNMALGRVALTLGDLDEAERALRQAIDDARRLADAFQQTFGLVSVAEVALLRGRLDEADALCDAVAREEALGSRWLEAAETMVRARSARARGDLEEALRLCVRALGLQRDNGYLGDAVATLELVAGIQAERGLSIAAARLFGAADSARRRLGLQRRPVDVPGHRADRARLLHAADHAAHRDARHAGAALTLVEAITYAIRGRGARTRQTFGWEGLTPTEAAVVHLVADGRTNPEIARHLLISPATVKAHLSRIFTKLDVTNRTELAAEAARRYAESQTGRTEE